MDDNIKNSRMDGCMEALEYYAQTFLDKGLPLTQSQREDFEEKCNILSCMGEECANYADTMRNLLNK